MKFGCIVFEFFGNRERKSLDLRSLQRQTMVGRGAGYARRGLDRIQTIHLIARTAQMAAAIKLFLIPNVARTARKKIPIERKNDVGLFDAINGVEIPAKRQ